jgi:hypothetical protein
MPENLPPTESIKKLEKKAEQPKLKNPKKNK